MGGDFGPKVTVPASLLALEKHDNLRLLLVGDEALLREELNRAPKSNSLDRLDIIHTTQTVAMDELPSVALRVKKDSSMRVAINKIKEGAAGACVSAGNTGA